MHNVASASSSNAPKHLISADRAKPANCFVVNGSASEGIMLALNHPAVPQGVPALMLSERRYIGRHRISSKGCLYEVAQGGGIVRRASLEEISLSGGRNIPILGRLDVEKSSYLLVHVLFGLADGAKMRAGVQPLYAGVRGAQLVSDGPSEALMRVKSGELLKIFYPQGHVGMISHADILAGKKVVMFDAETSLAERLNLLDDMLNDDATEDRKVEVQNSAGQELSTMLMRTKLYPDMRTKLMARMEKMMLHSPFTEDMRKQISGALRALGSVTYYGWLARQEAVVVRPQTDVGVPARKYDGELHGLITEAMAGSIAWSYVTLRLIKASEDGQFRPGVRNRFLLQCTDSALTDQVANLPYVEGVKKDALTSPLGSKTKKVDKAALQARRDERNRDRPVGMTGSKVNPGEAARKRREAEETLRQNKKK